MGTIWEGSRSDVGIFRENNGNKYGNGWRKVKAFVKKTWDGMSYFDYVGTIRDFDGI